MLPTQTIPDQQLQQQQESQQSQQSQDRQYQPQQPFQQQQQIILYQQQQQQQQQLQQQQEYKKPKTANYKIRSYSSQEQHDQAQIRQGGQTVFTNKVLSQAYRPLNGIQKRESSFVLDCQRFSNIEHEIYDPLKDGHLGSFFSNKRNKELLYRHKVLKRKGNNSNILPRDNNILRSPKNKTQNNLTFNGSLMLDQDIHQNDLSNNAHRRLPRLEKYFVHVRLIDQQQNNLRSNSQQVEGVTKEERVLGSQSQFEERQNIYGKYDYDEHQGELLKQPQQGYIQSQGEQYSFIEGAQRKAEMTAISGKQVFSQKQIEQQKQLQLLKARKEDSKDKQIIKQDTIDGKVDNKTAGTSQSSSCSANIILSPASSNNNNNTNHNNSKRLSRSKRGKSESNQRTIKNNYLIKPSQPPNNSPMNQQNYQQQQQNKQDHQNNEIIIQPHQIDLNNNNNTTNHIKINNNIYNSPFLQGNSYGNSKGVYGYLVQQQNQIIKSAQQQQALIQAIQKNGMNQKTKQQKSPEKLQKDNEQVQATKLSGNNTVEQINADQEQQNQQQSKQTVKSENNHTNNDDQNINTNNINTINQSNNQKIIIAPTSAIIQPQSQQQQQQQSRQLLNQKHSQHYSQSKSYRPSNNTTATSPGLMDIYSKIEVLPYSPKNLNTNSNFKYPKQPRTLKRKELPQLNKEQFVSFLEKFKSKCAIFQPSQSTLPLSQLNNQESSMSQFNQPISNQIQQHTEQVQLNQPQITQIQKGTL